MKILFFTGSVGLGHVWRDLAIAREIRRLGGAEISWLAAPPADRVIKDAGEILLPESALLANDSEIAERRAGPARLSLIRYAAAAGAGWSGNVDLVDRLVAERGFDLLVGDETYEVSLAYKKQPGRRKCPFVMIYDFIGIDAMSWSPVERIGAYVWNRSWADGYKQPPPPGWLGLFIGEEADIPDRRFGFLLPRRRDWARARCRFVGYVLPFDPANCSDRSSLRARLGYDASPLVIGAIGGTAIGKELLCLCGRAFPFARRAINDLRMVLVCGPRLDPKDVAAPSGVEVRGYVPSLYEHLAACDLAVVQGGGTVTLELTALRRPFLYFPIEGHSEQEVAVFERLKRHGAGVRLRASTVTPAGLAQAITEHLGRPVSYPPIPTDGARTAAHAIADFAGWAPRPSLSATGEYGNVHPLK